MLTIETVNTADAAAVAGELAPLFEGAPEFVGRLVAARPFDSEEDMFDSARAIAREMPFGEQVTLLAAHPPIGADPAAVSAQSRHEQGYDGEEPADDHAWVADELRALNEAYEARFGFRFVVFVAGRPRSEIIPLLEAALRADPEDELRRGLDDVVLIAADRMRTLHGPPPLREELREAIALEVSRYMVGELDREGLVRAAQRLIEQDVVSPGLLALSLVDGERAPDDEVAALMSEIGLGGWDAGQAGQLLALHAAASIVGEVSQPIDGARRIASVARHPEFRDLVARWEGDPERRDVVDGEIRRAAAELFGPPEVDEELER